MGFAPIKWTCTAFFRPRQLTDRAILAIRQTQEKKSTAGNAYVWISSHLQKHIRPWETFDTVINQLVFQGQRDLEQFVDDHNLFIRVVGEIMTEFNMQQPLSAIASYKVGSLGTKEAEGNKKWIRIFCENSLGRVYN